MCLVLQKPYGLHHNVAENVAMSAGVMQLLDSQPSQWGIHCAWRRRQSETTVCAGLAGMRCR